MVSFLIKCKTKDFFVAINADHKNKLNLKLPDGNWGVLVNAEVSGSKIKEEIKGEVIIEPISGMILLRE